MSPAIKFNTKYKKNIHDLLFHIHWTINCATIYVQWFFVNIHTVTLLLQICEYSGYLRVHIESFWHYQSLGAVKFVCNDFAGLPDITTVVLLHDFNMVQTTFTILSPTDIKLILVLSNLWAYCFKCEISRHCTNRTWHESTSEGTLWPVYSKKVSNLFLCLRMMQALKWRVPYLRRTRQAMTGLQFMFRWKICVSTLEIPASLSLIQRFVVTCVTCFINCHI